MKVSLKSRLRLSVFAVVLFGAVCVSNPVPSLAQNDLISNVAKTFDGESFLVRAGIVPALDAGQVMSVRFTDPEGMRAFYAAREFKPLWIQKRGRRTGRAAQALEVLERSWEHGLNPEQYHLGAIHKLMARRDEDSLFALELMTSDAVVRYVRDLSAMRVATNLVNSTIRDMQTYLLSQDVLAYIAGSTRVQSALERFEPQGNLYTKMREELVRLVTSGPEPYEDVLPIRMAGLLKPGQTHGAVAPVRRRLGVSGVSERGDSYYDDALAQAVMAFQTQNGLVPDGVIGPQTLEIMNISRAQKIDQIVANLERLRWVARDTPSRYVLVNIPSATLWAIENGRAVLEMPVILGRKKRETESFVANIKGIRFNPNWTVPPTIKKKDFLPKLVDDPYYATNRGVELVRGYGENAVTLDPGTVDWANMTWDELKNIRMIQAPGRSNPLGQIRVLMPNRYNIYLHDTSTPQDFKKNNRYLSSGCIRVSQPQALTHFIMKDNPDWDDQVLSGILDGGKMRDVESVAPLPVFVLYQTVWLHEDGGIVYGRDVYGRDHKLIQAIKSGDLFRVPQWAGRQERIVYKTSEEGVAPDVFNP